jgi:putative hydrolase of HD superfamily
VAGVRDPESVAEHSFRAAWIGWLLARKAGADASRVALMCLLNDLHEARINDQHRVAQTYFDAPRAEANAFRDQVANLADGSELDALFREFQTGTSPEAQLARDADRLECAFQAREYEYEGCAACRDWLVNARDSLATREGRDLFAALSDSDPLEWMRGLPRSRG